MRDCQLFFGVDLPSIVLTKRFDNIRNLAIRLFRPTVCLVMGVLVELLLFLYYYHFASTMNGE